MNILTVRWPKYSYYAFIIGVILAAILNAGICIAGEISGPILRAPEQEIAAALSDIDILKKQLEAARTVTKRDGIGPQQLSSQRALSQGIQYFQQQEYLSAIRELNDYLTLTQVPNQVQLLTALEKLGQAYEKVSKNRQAITSYLKYLATFSTSQDQDFDQMISVVRRTLILASQVGVDKQHDIGTLLASIASLDLPASIRPEILYLTARTAIKSGKEELANAWLQQATVEGKGVGLKSRTLYFQALIEINKEKWDQASTLLTEAVTAGADSNDDAVDLSRLALARIAVHKRSIQTAIRHYESIKDTSSSHRDAVFESIYVYLSAGRFQEAQERAVLFLAKYPNGPDATQIRSLISYLDLKSGNSLGAKQGIESSTKSMNELSRWISAKIVGKSTLTYQDLQELNLRSKMNLAESPLIRRGLNNFSALADLKGQLATIRSHIRNLTFTLGRTTAFSFNPSWVNRSEQLTRATDKALEIGHRLIASEKILQAGKLSTAQNVALAASEDRRLSLNSLRAQMNRQRNRWASLGSLLDLTSTVARKYERMLQIDASISTVNYLENVSQAPTNISATRSFDRRSQQLRESLARALELIRIQRVHEILVQSPHRIQAKYLSQYALALDDEAKILKAVRDSAQEAHQRFIAEDTNRAWEHWRFVMEEIFRQIQELETDVKGGLKQTLESIDIAENQHRQLEAKLQNLTSQLETRLADAGAIIYGHYNSSLSTRLSQQRKWAGDLEWMSFEGSLDRESTDVKKIDLERQILNDNLQNLYQGALWKWPE